VVSWDVGGGAASVENPVVVAGSESTSSPSRDNWFRIQVYRLVKYVVQVVNVFFFLYCAETILKENGADAVLTSNTVFWNCYLTNISSYFLK